jgi:hypothetical protein
MEFWQILGTSSVVAAGVTILVNRILKGFDDDELRSAIKQAIQAEIAYARDFALDYLKPGAVRSPMHRITTAFYREGATKLIALRAINYECARALLQYYGNIDQLNRSLDVVLGLQKPEERERKLRELRRTYLKACSLVAVEDLRQVAAMQARDPLEHRSLTKKIAKYGDRSPYDRVKRTMGFV